MRTTPNIDGLGNRLDIKFESTSYHDGSNADKVESLIDGDLAAKTRYGVLVSTNTKSHFKFTINSLARIYAYGTSYSDSAGSTGQIVALYKDDVKVGEYQTYTDEWYVLFDSLEAGTYQLKIVDKLKNYVNFTEWYVEDLEDRVFAVKQGNKYYSLNKNCYDPQTKMFNEVTVEELIANKNMLVSAEHITRNMVVEDEEFTPLSKFTAPQLVTLDKIDISVKGIKSSNELVMANNNFSTSIIESIDFIDSVSTIDELSDIKMVVSNDCGSTWLYTNDCGYSWEQLGVSSINKDYDSLNNKELEAWETFKQAVNEHGFSMKELNTINFNDIKSDVLKFAYVLNVDSKESICKAELLNIQFNTHGKIQKLKDSEVNITIDSFNAYVIPNRDIKLMKINMLG